MKLMACLFGLMFLPMLAEADTLYLTNNSSLNGKVLYADDKFYVEASYLTGVKHYEIPRSGVSRDKINDEDLNQGSPGPRVTGYEMPAGRWAIINSRVYQAAKIDPTTTSAGTSTVMLRDSPSTTKRTTARFLGHDTVNLKNSGQTYEGTLVEMTADVVVLRQKGQQTDTRLKRDDVKFVTVGRSGSSTNARSGDSMR
jgi:hypothetical protein